MDVRDYRPDIDGLRATAVGRLVATMPPPERLDHLRNRSVHIADVDAAIDAAGQDGKSLFGYVSKVAIFGPLIASQFVIDGECTYSDTDHWSAKGEEVFGRRLLAGSARLREPFGLRDEETGPGA